MKLVSKINPLLFLGLVQIPTGDLKNWIALEYKKIPGNKVSVTGNGLNITVQKSASPLIFKIEQPVLVTGFSAKVIVHGNLEPSKTDFPEDSVFRLGLVLSGTKTLNGMQKLFAADWIKKLFSLAPPGQGIDHIDFYMLGRPQDSVGSSRVHPKSDLLTEKIIDITDSKKSEYIFSQNFAKSLKVVALWISSDGDETKSSYALTLKDFSLTTE